MKQFNDWWDTYCQQTSIPNSPQREELARVAFLAGQARVAGAAPIDVERIISGIIDNGRFGKEADELRLAMNPERSK